MRRLNKWLIGSTILLAFLLHGIQLIQLPIVNDLEILAEDIRLNAMLPGGVDQRIIIADIDETSLQRFGQWPWNRHLLKDLVDTLFHHYQAKVLGFDMVFAEPAGSRFKGLTNELITRMDISEESLAAVAYEAYQDDAFAMSLKNRNVVLGIFFNQNQKLVLNEIPPPLLKIDAAINDRLTLPKPIGHTSNLPDMHATGLHSGFFDNPVVDSDGIFRRVPLLQSLHGELYPSLALKIAQIALEQAEVNIELIEQGPELAIESLQLGYRVIPTDRSGAVKIPFRGPEGSFPYIAAADILDKKIDKTILEDKIIILGTSAAGLLDLRSTPVDESMPGVEVHANIIAGILDQNIIQEPSYIVGVQFVVYLLLGIALMFIPGRLSPIYTLIMYSVLALAIIYANLYFWKSGLLFPLATPLLLILVFFIFHMSWGYFFETKNKRAITRLFGQYIPPQLAEQLAKEPAAISLKGQNKELSVLFSDVRNFTSISESLNPEQLSQLMNAILTPITESIYQHMGTVDKYMGDAAMAFWGAPLSDEAHAQKAVLCALDIQQRIKALSLTMEAQGQPAIAVGVGVNSGLMSVGNMGSEYRVAYTVIGDAVNLGSRLEGLCKSYGANIIVSDTTRQLTADIFYRNLDYVRVKGKKEPILICEPLSRLEDCNEEDIKISGLFDECLSFYRTQEWERSEDALNRLEAEARTEYSKLISIYRQRIQDFKESPPGADWDGVYTHTSK